MKIAIFGGTFNPVHTEHVNLIKNAIKELSLDKLIVVPTFIAPHKEDLIPAPSTDRINMLKIALSGIEKVEISDYEIVNGGKSYTYLTMEYFKNLYQESELFFIVGEDMLSNFKFWKFPDKILSTCTLVAFSRAGENCDFDKEQEYFNKTFNTSFIKLNYCGKNVSSTEIRTYLSFGFKPSYIDEKVFDYIKDNGLYGGDKYIEFVKKTLTEKRLYHTANVVVCALSKAKELKLDVNKVKISATLHDVAKYLDYRNYKDFNLDCDVPEPVVHAFLGAFVAEKILGIEDQEILDAIKYHTSGKANMTTLGKLIFVADMVEKDRVYDGVEHLRELYKGNFEDCFTECLKEEVIHLLNKKKYIYKETLNAYDYYVGKKE